MYDQQTYDRIMARVRKDEATGCWLWTGPWYKNRKYAAHRYGYIMLWDRAAKKSNCVCTHRAIWIAVHGPLTRDQHVCHRCDNPLCVNVESHLFIGSHGDNMADSRRKGRHFLSAKTICKRGHPLSGDNLEIRNGLRHCKTCNRIRQRLRAGWPEDLALTMDRVPSGKRPVNIWRRTASTVSGEREVKP